METLINCDLGESELMAADGRQEKILTLVQLANVCCGAHAGNADLTKLTMRQCFEARVRAGAHPGYPDPEHFGRRSLFGVKYDAQQISGLVSDQVALAKEAAEASGLALYHVKPHGALYNEAAENGEVAEAIAKGVRKVVRDVFLVGLAKSVMVGVFRRQGFVVLREAFVDRRYTAQGLLVPRSAPDAVIEDPEEARRQMLQLRRFSDTICVHSDSPNSVKMLQALK